MENRLDGWITDNAPEDVKAVRDLYWTAKFASVSAKQDGGDPMQNADFRNTLSAGLHAYLRLGGEVTLDGETLRSLKGARTM
jgi:hypothetical protein